jgi:hypothetical protein
MSDLKAWDKWKTTPSVLMMSTLIFALIVPVSAAGAATSPAFKGVSSGHKSLSVKTSLIPEASLEYKSQDASTWESANIVRNDTNTATWTGCGVKDGYSDTIVASLAYGVTSVKLSPSGKPPLTLTNGSTIRCSSLGSSYYRAALSGLSKVQIFPADFVGKAVTFKRTKTSTGSLTSTSYQVTSIKESVHSIANLEVGHSYDLRFGVDEVFSFSSGTTYPSPGSPSDLTYEVVQDGLLLRWSSPSEGSAGISYTIAANGLEVAANLTESSTVLNWNSIDAAGGLPLSVDVTGSTESGLSPTLTSVISKALIGFNGPPQITFNENFMATFSYADQIIDSSNSYYQFLYFPESITELFFREVNNEIWSVLSCNPGCDISTFPIGKLVEFKMRRSYENKYVESPINSIKMPGIPSEPTDLQAISTAASKLTYTFSPSTSDAGVVTYEVEYRKKGTQTWLKSSALEDSAVVLNRRGPVSRPVTENIAIVNGAGPYSYSTDFGQTWKNAIPSYDDPGVETGSLYLRVSQFKNLQQLWVRGGPVNCAQIQFFVCANLDATVLEAQPFLTNTISELAANSIYEMRIRSGNQIGWTQWIFSEFRTSGLVTQQIRIEKQDGTPLKDINIEWVNWLGNASSAESVRTNVNGLASFSRVPSGPISLSIYSDQNLPINLAGTFEANANGLLVKVTVPDAPARTTIPINVQFLGEDGNIVEIPEATVRIDSGLEFTKTVSSSSSTFTYSDGKYVGMGGMDLNLISDMNGVANLVGWKSAGSLTIAGEVTFSDGDLIQTQTFEANDPTSVTVDMPFMPYVEVNQQDVLTTYGSAINISASVAGMDPDGRSLWIENAKTGEKLLNLSYSLPKSVTLRTPSGASKNACTPKVSTKLDINGSVSLKMCALAPGDYRIDGPGIVDSKSFAVSFSPVPPRSVENLKTTATKKSIKSTWSKPKLDGGSLISKYSVRIVGPGINKSVEVTSATASFSGLKRKSVYKVTVVAITKAGLRSAAKISTVKTK